jgi:thiol-disulfide isomerase/thioredoxin
MKNPQKRLLSTLLLLIWIVPGFVFPQSLGELARREQERRKRVDESGVGVTEHRAKGPAPAEVATRTMTAAPAAPALAVKGPAPSFTLEDRDGRSVSLSYFRGRPVLIDFWASWCGPCRKSMPSIEQLYRKYRGSGLQVVGINIEGRTPATLQYLSAGGYTFPVLFDSGNWNSPVARSYHVSSIPRTFLIDGDGNILYAGHPASLPEAMLQDALR